MSHNNQFAPAGNVSGKVVPSLDYHCVQNPALARQKAMHALPLDATTEEYQRLIADLQQALEESDQEVEDLEIELMELIKSRDQSPAAILFFALMNDPSYIPNLQQLVLQFQHLKQFLNYSVHMDYLTLRKRLQVCLVLMPSIEKLLDKYSMMHQSWSHVRLNWFAERKLRGGSADSLTYCPLCYHDLEEKKELEQHGHRHEHHHNGGIQQHPSKGSTKGSKAQTARQQVKTQRKKLLHSVSHTVTLPALQVHNSASGAGSPMSGHQNSARSLMLSASSGQSSGRRF
jgi:hypothetical protein